MKRLILFLFLQFSILNFQFPSSSLWAGNLNNDTILFHYDGPNETLTMKDPSQRSNLCFELNGEFANWLMEKMIEVDSKTERTDDNSCKLVYSPSYTFERVVSFDSIGCSTLKMHFWTIEDGEVVSGRETIPVKVTVKPKIEDGKSEMERSSDATANSQSSIFNSQFNGIIVIIAIVVVVAAGVVTIVLLKRKKKADKPIEEKAAELGLEVVEVVSSNKDSGLSHVRADMDSYYTMDISKDFSDTSVSKIYLHHTAVKKMYDFFKQSLESSEQTQETGCYFIGCWENVNGNEKVYNISVEDIVLPGDDIVPGEFSFSFGKIISLNLNALIDQTSGSTGRDYVQTVWMHSHPGLGLFLSAHDLLVQQQLHYPEAPGRLAAFVIDTNTPHWDFAVFTPKVAGGMNNKEELRRTYSLDSLYEWSRHVNNSANNTKTNEVSIADLSERYHSIQVNHQGNTRTINLLFSGKTINIIDDIVYRSEGLSKIGGYLLGNVDTKGNIFIEDCSEEYTPKALGLLVTDSQSSYHAIKERYLSTNTWLCAIVCRSDEEMWIATRQSADQPCPNENDIAVSSMRPMKEWLRRRRVYK